MFDETLIQNIRNEIYLGKGYYVIRSYVSPAEVARMVAFWKSHANRQITERNNQLQFYCGCPNYTLTIPQQIQIHFNFFWNPPLDQKTYNVCWEVNSLRNIIEGRSMSTDFNPAVDSYDQTLRACCYRVVFQRDRHGVGAHSDWEHEPFRIQTSLQFSEWGVDYDSGGLRVTTNAGEEINVCREERLKPGDLLIFRYSNHHAVEEAKVHDEQQIGYVRIIFTQPPIEPNPPSRRALGKYRLKQVLKQFVGQSRETVTDDYKEVIKAVPKTASPDKPMDDPKEMELKRIALSHGIKPVQIFHPKGLFFQWRERQRWQLELLQKWGLKPDDQLLELGCGILLTTNAQPVTVIPKPYPDWASFSKSFDAVVAQTSFTEVHDPSAEETWRRLKSVIRPDGLLVWSLPSPERESDAVTEEIKTRYKALAETVGATFLEAQASHGLLQHLIAARF